MRRWCALAAIAFLASCGGRERPYRDAPVIIISVDTLRSDHLHAYGYGGVATPNVDALRADSILFERAYSHCPMTLPSHVSIMTGLLPTEHHVRNNIGYRLERGKVHTLAAVLRKHGYATAAAVSSYVLRSETGIDDGFDSYDDQIPVAAAGALSEHQRSGYDTLKAADAWLTTHASQRFFYFFHIYEPHAPYTPTYDADVAKADDIVGRLVARLKATGIYDRALIVFLSDHGEGLYDHGEDQHGILLYREALQVPLLIKLPRLARRGTSVARPAQLADVYPTVLDALGIAASPRSLLRDSPPRPIYSETLYPRIHLGWSELRSLIDGSRHLIDGTRAELFDPGKDPQERHDLAASERRIASSLRAQLQQFPSEIEAISSVDPEEAKKLAALGYIGTPGNRTGPLPDPRDVIGQLGDIKAAFHLADERRYDQAVPALRALLAKNPRLADVWSKLGEVLVQSGRYGEAIDAYKSAIAQSERFSPDLALGLGLAHLGNGQPQQAIEDASVAMAMNPREANELSARAAIELRRFDAAETFARNAIAAGDRQPTSILVLAEVQRAVGKLPVALATIAEAERRANDLEVPHLYGADYLRGDLLARMDRPDDAIAAYRREIGASPEHLQSYANLAVIFMIEGRRDDADAALDAMARANPHRGAYLLAAKTLDAFGEKKGAARWRERAAQ
jgi:arylsulfatase A-like enzyme/Flp pilus assembly protein TadD